MKSNKTIKNKKTPIKTNKRKKSIKTCTRKLSADPRVFGPDMWATLHRISVNYPKNPNKITRKNAIRFIKSLPYMIPCTHCGCHFSNFTKEHNLKHVSKNRYNITSFFVNAHNNVSKHTNPNNKPWTTEQAMKKYKYENKCFHSKLWYDCDINKCKPGFKKIQP
jgi:hypothetical protein